MERFAFKIDKALKANLYKICRLCGIDNPEKVPILGDTEEANNEDDGEPELWRKIEVCIGLIVSKDDKMPQTMCSLCVDKINDFFEFREMCFATNAQTRKLLGLKEEKTNQQRPVEVNKESPEKCKECMCKIKDDLDAKLPIATPVSFAKRALFGKGKRKRKADDAILRARVKDDMDDVKYEKPSTSSMPLRKKSKLSNCTINTSSSTTSNNSTSNVTNTSANSLQKRAKPLTPLQRRALVQAERKLKPKDEIKEEDEPNDAANSKEAPSKLNSKFPIKFRHLCNICDQRFMNKTQLERHLYSTHVPSVPRYFCTACNETMKKNNEIKNHQLWHKLSKTPFVCGLCDECVLSSYAYSRHLREHIPEVPTAMLVLDRQCPQCQETFSTTFLYNIHPCSVKTKKCAGCSRYLKNDIEYNKHASVCPKMFINYSKHIPAAAVAAESNVRIKNENEVEAAAAAEALAVHSSSNTAINMTPVVSLTRLSTPMLMQSNQCVSIPSENVDMKEDLPMSPTPKTPKKANKKGVSRKELKRVDELLKSTMDTLVSIKHEPEVHMVTCEVPHPLARQLEGGSSATEDDTQMEDLPSHSPSPAPADDFDNDSTQDEDDEQNDEPVSSIAIKQEPDATLRASIKQEAPDEDVNVNKVPVLKLKITKEHGKLNSSIVQEEDSVRSEKKKKKKKRKDMEKEKERAESASIEIAHKDPQQPEISPQLGVVNIKQECHEDDNNLPTPMQQHSYNHQEPVTMSSLIMTSIPQPLGFQISAISSGVDFNIGAVNNDENEAAPMDAHKMSTEDQVSTPLCADEMEDIKPCRESLDRLLKITDVSGGVAMTHKESEVDGTQEVSMSPNADVSEKHNKSKSERSPHKLKKSHRKAMKSTSGVARTHNVADYTTLMPQIVAVTSGNDANNIFSSVEPELSNVIIKEERFDESYGDQLPQANIEGSQKQVDDSENSFGIHQSPAADDNLNVLPRVHVPTEAIGHPTTELSKHDFVSTGQISELLPSSSEPAAKEDHRRATKPAEFEDASADNEPEDEVEHDSEVESEDEPEHFTPTTHQRFNKSEDLNLVSSSGGKAHLDSQKMSEEQAYIANIDFNNIVIKQEKDIEVSEVQLNDSALLNGFITKKRRSNQQTNLGSQNNRAKQDTEDDEELQQEENEDDEEEEDGEEDVEDDDDDDDEEEDDENSEDCEEREYREMELPPMMLQNVSVSSTQSREVKEMDVNEQQHQRDLVDGNIEQQNAHDLRSPIMLISNVVSNALEPLHSPTKSMALKEEVEFATQQQYLEAEAIEAAIVSPAQQFKILSVVSESIKSEFKERDTTALDADSTSSLAVTSPHTISGSIMQDDEVDSKAQPFFEQTQQETQEQENVNETTSLLEHHHHVDTDEQYQNQLNHEMLNERSGAAVLLENQSSISLEALHPTPISETTPIFSCSISHLPNVENPSTSSQLLRTPPSSPKINEEIENQINESNDAAFRHHLNTAILTQQPIAVTNNSNINNLNVLLDNESNINEIAENNNNANIERELQDDTSQVTTREHLNPDVATSTP